MKHQEKPIIIVRRRKHKGHGGGHGSWKIAYADFMTAMMAFFLVMWLISIASPTQLAQIADYFRTPLAAAITGGHRLTDSSSPIPGGGDDVTQQHGEEKKEPKSDLEDLKKNLDKMSDTRRLKKLHEDLDQLIESDPRLRELRPHLRIDLIKQGLRIQIIDSQNRPMFKLGSAEVEPYMRDILRAIAPVLNSIPNKITISGHTDDLPYARGERSYSNWELSADRANASRRELVAGGLDSGKVLRVVGMAATMNLSNRPDDALNRRISLVVLNKAAEQEIMRNNAESENAPLTEIKDDKPSLTPAQTTGKPTSGSSTGTRPANGSATNGAPAGGNSTNKTSAGGTSTGAAPAGSTSINQTSTNSTPAEKTPAPAAPDTESSAPASGVEKTTPATGGQNNTLLQPGEAGQPVSVTTTSQSIKVTTSQSATR